MKQIKSTRVINRKVANFINKELNNVLNSINKDISYLICGSAAKLVNNFNKCTTPINVVDIKIADDDIDTFIASVPKSFNIINPNITTSVFLIQYHDWLYIRFNSITTSELFNTEFENFNGNLFIECK